MTRHTSSSSCLAIPNMMCLCAKGFKMFRLFIDLGTRSSLEGRTSSDWFGQIVRLVPLFFKLGICHTLIQPPVVFSLGFFVGPLEERAASLGTGQIKTMSVLVRSRHGKYERQLTKTTHGGRIKAGSSGLVDGMQRLFDPMQIHGHVRSATRYKTFGVIGNGGTTVIAPRFTSFTFHFVVLKRVSAQRAFWFVLHNVSLFLLWVVVVGRDEHLIQDGIGIERRKIHIADDGVFLIVDKLHIVDGRQLLRTFGSWHVGVSK